MIFPYLVTINFPEVTVCFFHALVPHRVPLARAITGMCVSCRHNTSQKHIIMHVNRLFKLMHSAQLLIITSLSLYSSTEVATAAVVATVLGVL